MQLRVSRYEAQLTEFNCMESQSLFGCAKVNISAQEKARLHKEKLYIHKQRRYKENNRGKGRFGMNGVKTGRVLYGAFVCVFLSLSQPKSVAVFLEEVDP